jgi:rubredoxin-NAD+ reductase
MRRFRCAYCAHVYDEVLGDVESGIPPGTLFEDLPEDWCCIECGAIKSDFQLIVD